MNVLAINPGSNTLKYKQIRIENEQVLARGKIDGIQGEQIVYATRDLIRHQLTEKVDCIGSRVVHGGPQYFHPQLITSELVQELKTFTHLAPQHLATDLAVIEAMRECVPEIPVIAVFDTEFHLTMPEEAVRYGLPGAHFRRYGFHGTAYQFVAKEICHLMKRSAEGMRLIAVHLGSGASVCAIRDGKSVDTSMGYTPLEGLMMSTRSGDLDPAIVIELFREGRSCEEVEELLNRQSGLLGLSELSADIRQLEPATDEGNRKADLALEVYAHRCRRYIGAMLGVLGGCDVLVFSGGLAENSPTLRQRILRGLEGLGMMIDHVRNAETSPQQAARISHEEAPVEVWVVPVDEELEIARSVQTFLQEQNENGSKIVAAC